MSTFSIKLEDMPYIYYEEMSKNPRVPTNHLAKRVRVTVTLLQNTWMNLLKNEYYSLPN